MKISRAKKPTAGKDDAIIKAIDAGLRAFISDIIKDINETETKQGENRDEEQQPRKSKKGSGNKKEKPGVKKTAKSGV